MNTGLITMQGQKKIAMIAHDNKKSALLEWARYNRKLLATELNLDIHRFASGPLGGDQQVGAKIVEGDIDFIIFFWDPLEPQPHDVDVKALLRIAVVYNIPTACNRASADFIISSPLMDASYERIVNARLVGS